MTSVADGPKDLGFNAPSGQQPGMQADAPPEIDDTQK
jgi:hypothetical protein